MARASLSTTDAVVRLGSGVTQVSHLPCWRDAPAWSVTDGRRPAAALPASYPLSPTKRVEAVCGSLVRRGYLSRCARLSPCGTHMV